MSSRTTSLSPARASATATIIALLLLPIGAAPFVALWTVDGLVEGFNTLGNVPVALLVVGCIGSVVVHEALHAVAMWYPGRLPSGSIRFGFHGRMLMPYVTSTGILPAWAYRVVIVTPGIAMGLAPLVVGIFTGSGALAVYGTIMLSSAAGDLLILWIIRNVSNHAWVRDSSETLGCEVVQAPV